MTNKKMDIVYEDRYLLIINKPSKLLTVATDKEKEKTLYHEASMYVKKKHKSNKIFIVNRLDKDTSGIVVFAKDEKLKKELQDNWNKYALKREYIALVKGVINPKKASLKNKLVETKTNLVYIDEKAKGGKLAITNYEFVKEVGGNSLIMVEILTGRKNQIRVQLNNINHPVVGDMKYGKNKSFYNRLMLHAYKLVLINPATNEKLELVSKLPKEFNKIL